MFGLFKQKEKGTVARFNIHGMHCVSCSLNIDGALEDTNGVIKSVTHFAKGIANVEYDPTQTSPEKLLKIIKNTGYTAEIA
jgi:copper chaperone CopZ